MIDIWNARLAGYDFLFEEYVETIAVVWPCGNLTKFKNIPNLYELGNAIAGHGIECEVCVVGEYCPPEASAGEV